MSGYQFKIEITADMIHKLHLKNTHLLVFALLDYYTKKNGCCVHPASTVADMLGLASSTVRNAINSLWLNYYIETEKVLTSDGSTLHKIRTVV